MGFESRTTHSGNHPTFCIAWLIAGDREATHPILYISDSLFVSSSGSIFVHDDASACRACAGGIFKKHFGVIFREREGWWVMFVIVWCSFAVLWKCALKIRLDACEGRFKACELLLTIFGVHKHLEIVFFVARPMKCQKWTRHLFSTYFASSRCTMSEIGIGQYARNLWSESS